VRRKAGGSAAKRRGYRVNDSVAVIHRPRSTKITFGVKDEDVNFGDMLTLSLSLNPQPQHGESHLLLAAGPEEEATGLRRRRRTDWPGAK